MYNLLVITSVVSGVQGGAACDQLIIEFATRILADNAYNTILTETRSINSHTDVCVIKLYPPL